MKNPASIMAWCDRGFAREPGLPQYIFHMEMVLNLVALINVVASIVAASFSSGLAQTLRLIARYAYN